MSEPEASRTSASAPFMTIERPRGTVSVWSLGVSGSASTRRATNRRSRDTSRRGRWSTGSPKAWSRRERSRTGAPGHSTDTPALLPPCLRFCKGTPSEARQVKTSRVATRQTTKRHFADQRTAHDPSRRVSCSSSGRRVTQQDVAVQPIAGGPSLRPVCRLSRATDVRRRFVAVVLRLVTDLTQGRNNPRIAVGVAF